jgi:heme exporter protein C
MKPAIPIFALITVALIAFGFYQGMYAAPTEQTMGDIQRIFYYHVPSAWTAFVLFFVNFATSLVYLVRRYPEMSKTAARTGLIVAALATVAIAVWPAGPEMTIEIKLSYVLTVWVVYALFWAIAKYTDQEQADAWALGSAEVGVIFCTIVLITGPLWAKPVWGIWWTWDARLTTTLVLWLIYVSYLMLRRFSEGQQTPTIAAALAIFGFLDVPIVYMSIRWWRTQHPQPVIGGGSGSGLDPAMWRALLYNWLAFMCLAGLYVWIRYSIARAEQEVEREHAMQSLRGAGISEPQMQSPSIKGGR